MWIGLAMRGERIVHGTAWCVDPFTPSVIQCCSSFKFSVFQYRIATPPLCWCCLLLRFGTPVTTRIFHPLSITSFARKVADRWCSVKIMTDTLLMIGKPRINFHFSSENPLIFILTHLKSTCEGSPVEDWGFDGRCVDVSFCFLLPGESGTSSGRLISRDGVWVFEPLRWGWVFLERTRILSGIQCTTHFIEFFDVETKRFVGSFVHVILTRQTCGQRSSKAAESKRRALGKYSFERIYYMFLMSQCRGDRDLCLYTTSGLAFV